MTDCRCLVVGLGNPLMGDDGIGPAVIARLSDLDLPAGLRAVEVGSDVSRLREFWEGEPTIWLVDAVDIHRPAGSISRIAHDQLLGLPHYSSTVHHLAASENLRWLLHGCPDLAAVRFTLWGVVPESISPRSALSPTADRAVDDLARQILHAWQASLETGARRR